MNWKAAMYYTEIEAQAKFFREEDHKQKVELLENLICNAYQTGNKEMEDRYRKALAILEGTVYDL